MSKRITMDADEAIAEIYFAKRAAIIDIELFRKMTEYVASIVTPEQLDELRTTYHFDVHVQRLDAEEVE